MTGNRWRDCADCIAEDNGAIDCIHSKYIKPPKAAKSKQETHPGKPLTDAELLDLAQKSKDGEAFKALWDGAWSGKYKSQSEADFALCRKLAFWSGRNETQVDSLFRQSGLYREKWDKQHSASGATYGETTISRACELTDKTYAPPAPKRESDIFEHGSAYWRNRNQKVYPITNFTIIPVEMICSDEETQIVCDLLTIKGESFRHTFMTNDFSNLQRFKNILNKKTIALSFKGSEGDLELLKEYAYELDWVRKRGKKALGIYPYKKRLAFVTPNRAVGAGGEEIHDIVQLEKYHALESRILDYPFITKGQMLPMLASYLEEGKGDYIRFIHHGGLE
jgi:hypothetical protein